MEHNNTENVADLLADKANAAHLKLDENIEWLKQQMSPYFLRLNQDESDALSLLATSLHKLEKYKRLTLVDRPNCLMLAQVDEKGSLYRTLHNLPLRKITYLELSLIHI